MKSNYPLKRFFAATIVLCCLLSISPCISQNILLLEDFESGDFAAKGWYDGFPDQRTTAEVKNGEYSYAGHFAQGATTSGAGRHLFTPTETLYMSYWVKYSSDYVGSGVGYHPHEWNVLTTKDGIWQGPSDTYLTLYIEQNAGRPILALQDSKNVDPDCILLNNNSFVGCNGDFNTYAFTEDRSVCSCNGLIGELDRRDCFVSSGNSHGYYSSRAWAADSIYFRNTEGPYYKNSWHQVETYFELNTIEAGVGIPNGKIRYWYDGQLLIFSDSILFRTATHPDMKFNQLFYGPYIGVGSPVDQTWWVDDLILADEIMTTATKKTPWSTHEIKIYPNPSQRNFIIEIPGKESFGEAFVVEVFDIQGKLILKQNYNANKMSLRLDEPKGIYFLRIKNKHGLFGLKKIILL